MTKWTPYIIPPWSSSDLEGAGRGATRLGRFFFFFFFGRRLSFFCAGSLISSIQARTSSICSRPVATCSPVTEHRHLRKPRTALSPVMSVVDGNGIHTPFAGSGSLPRPDWPQAARQTWRALRAIAWISRATSS